MSKMGVPRSMPPTTAGASGASRSTSWPKSGVPTRATIVRGSRVLSRVMMTYTRPVSGSLRTDAGTRTSNFVCARPDGPGRIIEVWAATGAAKAIRAIAGGTSRRGDLSTLNAPVEGGLGK